MEKDIQWLGLEEGEGQDKRLREDAKQLLRVAYERRVVDGVERMQVDLAAAAEHRGLNPASRHIGSLVDYMEWRSQAGSSRTPPLATPWATLSAESRRVACRSCARSSSPRASHQAWRCRRARDSPLEAPHCPAHQDRVGRHTASSYRCQPGVRSTPAHSCWKLCCRSPASSR